MSDFIEAKQISDSERIRTDLGDIDSLATSIKKYGLIQPIVLGHLGDEVTLIAGGRRLAALRRLFGNLQLIHGVHFVWKDEVNEGEDKKLRFKSMEIEENVKRKDLSWQEQVEGKRQLLQIMQTIHGIAKPGPTFKDEKGFGTNRLAAMLGEAQSNTSRDLQLAEAMAQIPTLKNAETKAQAFTQLKILGSVLDMHRASVANPPKVGATASWVLIEDDFRNAVSSTGHPQELASDSVDLIWTDLPYGSDITSMSMKSSTGATFDDTLESATDLLVAIATESFRVLRNDRFAVFCFGFAIYPALVAALENAGFNVALVPFIWCKNTKSTENPLSMYSNAYEPLLVARKGSPTFLIPGQSNVITIPVVQDRLQVVQKPVELIKKFLRDMVTPGATVVDWCAGTGSTGVACHELGMRSILFEKSPSMAAIARARLGALK